MPIYNYKCKDCGAEFEYFQSINSEPLTKWLPEIEGHKADCPGNIYRKISSSSVILKGTGFYETDYVKKKTSSTDSTVSSSSPNLKTETTTPTV